MAGSRRLSFGASLILGLCIAGPLSGQTKPAAQQPAADDAGQRAQEEFFENKVRPVIFNRCLECHGKEKSKAGLRLDSREAMLKGAESGPVVVPGKPGDSSLIEAIRYDGDVQMPPKGKLKDDEIAVLTEWVKRGAIWPAARLRGAAGVAATSPAKAPGSSVALSANIASEQRSFWSFQPLKDTAPPAVKDDGWPASPIDRFVLAKLEENHLAPAPEADKATWIRRAYFDLVGLPPGPAEVAAFLADESPGAHAQIVERLLASGHYGERWGRYWLDVARYGEDQAHSFQPRLYPNGYRYRDWVVRALNADMPYDQFVREQIAGDLIDGPARAERLAALGFFACGPVYYGDAQKHDQYADRIDTLTRGFLGLTVACARCHDHKYDPIPTADFYALEGVFASTEYAEEPAVRMEVVEAYKAAQSAIQAKDKEISTFLKGEADRLKLKVTGNGLKQIESKLPDPARKKLAGLRAELTDLKKKAPAQFPVIHTLKESSKPSDMPVLIRGNPSTPGAKVPRHFLSVLGGNQKSFGSGSGRLDLAQAIASEHNPLTARVIVNRVWQHHFGRGLVATPSNFGALGERPSHPELLDWLTRRFIASGWSLKSLHREIMLSSTYRQSSRFDSRGDAKDPQNVLLWRMNRRRLDVEAWRDGILAVAGRLDLKMRGPSMSLDSSPNNRRTLYAAISRHDLAWMLRLFDFPDPNITSGSRVETTVPIQQLFVLNSEFMIGCARAVAARVRMPTAAGDRSDAGDEELIRRAYELCFGRPPTEKEWVRGLNYVRAAEGTGGRQSDMSRWDRYALALLATSELSFVD